MNRQLVRLFGVIAAGFVLLLGFTTYWQLWASSSLAARQDNLHEVVREQSIDRGRILAANGEVLAKSVPRKTADGRRIYVRRYPHGPVFAQVTGYSSPTSNRSGLEQSQNDYLTGSNSDLSGVLAREFHSITGGTVKGNDVVTSLEPAVQSAAYNGLKATGLPGRRRRARSRRPARCSRSRRGRRYNPNAAVRGTAGLAADAARAGRAAARPRDAGPLPAGLDVQGHHRGGRARERQVHADQPLRRHRDVHSSTGRRSTTTAASASRRDRSRRSRSRTRSTRSSRRSARSSAAAANAARCCRTRWRASACTGAPQIDLPSNQVRRVGARRPRPPGPAPAARRQARPRAHGDRPVHARGHAAADGDGRRGDRERRRADASDARRPRGRAGGPHDHDDEAEERRARGHRRRWRPS